MSTDYLPHYPADTVPRSQPNAVLTERPVVLPTVAKLVLIIATLVIFTPMWLTLARQLGVAESWYALRLLALGGIGGIVTLLVLVVKLSGGLVKHLADILCRAMND